MTDYLKRLDDARTQAVKVVGLYAGDFVRMNWPHCVSWHEVTTNVFDHMFTCYDSNYRNGTQLTFTHNISQIHRKDDPWDHLEVEIMECSKGKFSRWGSKYGTPLLDEHKYQGEFTLTPWLWNYCGKNVSPKKPIDLLPYFQRLGMSTTDTKIPWNKAGEVVERFKTVRIKGWHPHMQVNPVTTFKKTISIEAKL